MSFCYKNVMMCDFISVYLMPFYAFDTGLSLVTVSKSFIFPIRGSESPVPLDQSPYKIKAKFAGPLEQWIESDPGVQV